MSRMTLSAVAAGAGALAAGSSADCARAASVWAKPAAAKANVRIESLRMNPL